MRAPCPTHTNFETAGRGASNEVTYAISNQRLVSFFASLDSIAHSGSIGSRARARSILRNLGLAREGFMACWWASGAPTRSELCPPVGLTCPGRAQPSPPLTPAFARPRPMRQQPPQTTPRHARPRSRVVWRVNESSNARTCRLPLAVTSGPWAPVGAVYKVTA